MKIAQFNLKPVKFPLSTQKSYMLVDAEGYANRSSYNERTINANTIQLNRSFKFDDIHRGDL